MNRAVNTPVTSHRWAEGSVTTETVCKPAVSSEVTLITAHQPFKHKQLMRDPLAGFLCCVNTDGTPRVLTNSTMCWRRFCIKLYEFLLPKHDKNDHLSQSKWTGLALLLPSGLLDGVRAHCGLHFLTWGQLLKLFQISGQTQLIDTREKVKSQGIVSAPVSRQSGPLHENLITPAGTGPENSRKTRLLQLDQSPERGLALHRVLPGFPRVEHYISMQAERSTGPKQSCQSHLHRSRPLLSSTSLGAFCILTAFMTRGTITLTFSLWHSRDSKAQWSGPKWTWISQFMAYKQESLDSYCFEEKLW